MLGLKLNHVSKKGSQLLRGMPSIINKVIKRTRYDIHPENKSFMQLRDQNLSNNMHSKLNNFIKLKIISIKQIIKRFVLVLSMC